MYKTEYILLVSILITACSKPSKLSQEFSCSKSHWENLETVEDFQQNFSIKIPKTWKSQLYYDELQSEIFCADTLKNLEDSYLMEFAFIRGKLNIDSTLQKQIHQITSDNHIEKVRENFTDFKTYKGYYFLGKGIKNNLDYHFFQYYLNLNSDHYLMVKTDIYGNEKVEERLCESYQVIESLILTKSKN